MTWLNPIPGLRREDPSHQYWLHDRPFSISITGVLRVQKSDEAMERIQATTHIWAPRGNNTHRALELHLAALFAPPLNSGEFHSTEFTTAAEELAALRTGDHTDWIEPLLTMDLWHQVDVIATERATCCLTRGVAGTYDLAYQSPRGRVLADLKTLGPNGRSYCVRAQLGGYMALEATHGIHYDYGHAIWAAPGQARIGELYSRRECLLAWAAAWTRYQAVHCLV